MFRGASSFNGDLSAWDMGKAVDLSDLFHGALAFNTPLATWNVSSVGEMEYVQAGQ